jgi:LacI family transcriptional regulator
VWQGKLQGQKRLAETVDDFAYRGVDGVMCAIHQEYKPLDYSSLLEKFPATVFYGDPGTPRAAYVESDLEQSFRLAVRHLVEGGRKRIAFVYSSVERQYARHFNGYKEELEANGLALDETLIHDFDSARPDLDAMEVVIEKIVVQANADAITSHSDSWACLFMKSLRKRGIKVPDSVAVTGYHNSYSTTLVDPALTSIDLHEDIAAKEMVSLLEKLIESREIPDEERKVRVLPELVVRESSQPKRG